MVSDPTAQTFFNVAGYPDQVNNPTAFSVSVSFNGSQCTASWDAQADTSYYQVFLGATAQNMVAVQPKLYATSYTFNLSNTPLFIQVCAVQSTGLSGSSSVVTSGNSTGILVYYGFVSTTSPVSSDITAMTSAIQTEAVGDYTLTQSGASANYPCFAFPASFTQPTSFELAGFVTGMQTSTVAIGGVSYDVYLSPYATSATSIAAILS